MSATISAYLDTRRKKDGGAYPLKIRVYYNYQTRLYPTNLDLTEDGFANSYKAEKPKGEENKKLKHKINALVLKAKDVADELKVFNFDKFEKKYLRPQGAGNNIFYHYLQAIEEMKADQRINTASSYDLSAKSFLSFLSLEGKYKGWDKRFTSIEAIKVEPDYIEMFDKDISLKNILDYLAKHHKKVILTFEEVTVDFLKKYEKWMIQQGKTRTTVGIYIRPLRALFNSAQKSEGLSPEIYPFGKGKFKIPGGRKVKKALAKADIKRLMTFPVPAGSPMEKARDLWLFTYLSNGMNVRDMANLRWDSYNGDTIVFYRNKIERTTKEDQKPIIVPVTSNTRVIIEKYGNKKTQSGYIFPFFNDCKTEEERVSKTRNTVRFINQHLKRLAGLAEVNAEVSCNWARHSFTTVAVNSGASLEFIQDSLGHQNIATTMNYWGGFEESVKKDIANKLLD